MSLFRGIRLGRGRRGPVFGKAHEAARVAAQEVSVVEEGDQGPKDRDPTRGVLGPGERLSRLSLDSLKRRLSWVRTDREAFRAEASERIEAIKRKRNYKPTILIILLTVACLGLVVFLIWLFPPRIPNLEILDFGLPDVPAEPDAGPQDAGSVQPDAGSDAGPASGRRRPTTTTMTGMTGELPGVLGPGTDPIEGLGNEGF